MNKNIKTTTPTTQTSLTLITTESFCDVPCNFYRHTNNNQILLTREQIGTALEYKDPGDAIYRIHNRHKDRLDKFSVVDKLTSTDGKSYDTILYTRKGIMEICRWSHKTKADQFMDWVWDIIEKYQNKELVPAQQQIDLTSLSESISSAIASGISEAMKPIYETITVMQEDIQDLKTHQTRKRKKAPSPWFMKMNPRYKLLEDYYGCKRKELYQNIYYYLEDTYDVSINELYENYCYENNYSRSDCYPMDAIEHNPKLKDAVKTLIDSKILEYGLQTQEQISDFRRKTLFDVH